MDESPVIRCPASLRAAALGKLYAAGRIEQQDALAGAIDSMRSAPEWDWDGLFIRTSAPVDELAAPIVATWIQPTSGNTAVVWPPPPDCPWSVELLTAAATFADERRIAVAQVIVAPDEGFSSHVLARGGFAHLADLLYLFAETASYPHAADGNGLHFLPRASDEPQRLATLLERTYEGTLDCPALDGSRTIEDVLAGYMAQGRYLPDHWYFVQDDARCDVGALLLADHAPAGNWEVVYMGLVPEARGRRLGGRLVDHALVAAHRCGAQRLVLAVDAANDPALAMYRRAGFVEWDRRTVYARIAPVTTNGA